MIEINVAPMRSRFMVSVGMCKQLKANGIKFADKIMQYCIDNGVDVSEGELNSWRNSIDKYVWNVIEKSNASDNAVFICEYGLAADMRIDWMLIGSDKNGNPSIIIGENKQWSTFDVVKIDDYVSCTVPHLPREYIKHPAKQVHTYYKLVEATANSTVAINKAVGNKKINYQQVICMHNANDISKIIEHKDNNCEVYSSSQEDADKLSTLIGEQCCGGDIFNLAQLLDVSEDYSADFACEMIADSIAGMPAFKDDEDLFNEKYQLNNEEYWTVSRGIELYKTMRDSNERVLVSIEGGAGKGKSCNGLTLFHDLSKAGVNVGFCVKTCEKRLQLLDGVKKCLKRKVAEGKISNDDYESAFAQIKEKILYLNSESSDRRKKFDVIIVDEAQANHKYLDKTTKENASDKRLFMNFLDNVKTACFMFYDIRQRLDVECFICENELRYYAKKHNMKFTHKRLQVQARSGGYGKFTDKLDSFIYGVHDDEMKFPKLNNFKVTISAKLDGKYENISYSEKLLQKNGDNHQLLALWSKRFIWHRDEDDKDKPDFNTLYIVNDGKLMYISKKWNDRVETNKDNSFILSQDRSNMVGYSNTVMGSEFESISVIIPNTIYYDKKLHKLCVNIWDYERNSRFYYSKRDGFANITTEEVILNELYILLTRARHEINLIIEDDALREEFARYFNITEFV